MNGAEVRKFNQPVFAYKGKDYRVAHEGGIVVATEKARLPDTLARVTSSHPLKFDKNNILLPQNSAVTNDMVSAAYPDEWERFARMFHFDKTFHVVSISTADLIGPTLLAGNRILNKGEVLTLVPKGAINEISLYAWGSAEDGYDYGEGAYTTEQDRDFYRRLVVNRTRGSKPVFVQTVPLE